MGYNYTGSRTKVAEVDNKKGITMMHESDKLSFYKLKEDNEDASKQATV